MEFSPSIDRKPIKITYEPVLLLSNHAINETETTTEVNNDSTVPEQEKPDDGEMTPADTTVEITESKRKRGRPRKHVLDIHETPSYNHPSPTQTSVKRRRGRPRGTGRLQLLAASGGTALDTAGGSFTPHVIFIGTGENIVNRITSFSQRGPRAICVLSAIGLVSNVLIYPPGCKSTNKVLKYDGSFEIVSLSGSFISDSSHSHRKKGMLSVSLAKPDGRVFGGAVASTLIAAGPVQLVVASFKQSISKSIKKWKKAAANHPTNIDIEEATDDVACSSHQIKQQLF